MRVLIIMLINSFVVWLYICIQSNLKLFFPLLQVEYDLRSVSRSHSRSRSYSRSRSPSHSRSRSRSLRFVAIACICQAYGVLFYVLELKTKLFCSKSPKVKASRRSVSRSRSLSVSSHSRSGSKPRSLSQYAVGYLIFICFFFSIH